MLNASEHHFRQRLKQEQQVLLHAVSRTDRDSRSADEKAVEDLADQATNAYTKECMLHIGAIGREQLHLVNDALVRLRGGAFGMCIACGVALSPKRLEAVPWARYCIQCQEGAETGLL